MAPILLSTSEDYYRLHWGSTEELPNSGALYAFYFRLVSGGKNPEVLSDTHHAFIIEPFFRIYTFELMVPVGTGFQTFFKEVLKKPLVGYSTTDRSLFVIYMSSVFSSLSQTQEIM